MDKKRLLNTAVLILFLLAWASIACRAQEVTMHRKSASYQEVSKEIERQTSYRFVNIQILQGKKNSEIQVDKMPLAEFLKRYLGDNHLVEDSGKRICIIQEDRSFSAMPDVIDNKTGASIKAKIVDKRGIAMFNVNITVIEKDKSTYTDSAGVFELNGIDKNARLKITHIGYAPKTVKAADIDNKTIVMEPATEELNSTDVTNAHTGLQSFQKERAAGSYVTISEKKLNRSTSTNIDGRLIGVASGVLCAPDPDNVNMLLFTIRGLSTIHASTAPLIILDYFPYKGDLSAINPNDVVNITVLKDAAALSIYGAQAGNGAIVITTRKAKTKQPLRISVNMNVTIGKKPDLFKSRNTIQAKDMVDLETNLYNEGLLDGGSYSNAPTLVTEILTKKELKLITEADANEQLDGLKSNDSRKDFEKYFYQASVNQQYAINISGGDPGKTYNFSAGYDKNRSSLVNNGFQRLTVGACNTFTFLKKLEFHIGINYANTITENNNGGKDAFTLDKRQLPSYIKLVDKDGNALPVAKDLAQFVKDSFNTPRPPMNWNYQPYDEIRESDNATYLSNLRFDAKLLYKIIQGWQSETDLRFMKQTINNRNLQRTGTYYTRHLINLFYNDTTTSNKSKFPVPVGDILDDNYYFLNSYQARSKINFNKTFNNDHSVTAIMAYETGKTTMNFHDNRLYGYDPETSTSKSDLNYSDPQPTFRNIAGLLNIPHADDPYRTIDEYNSFLANASYTYLDRINIYGSFRFDRYNIYGANTNRQWLPLWSVASYYMISKEAFFKIPWVSSLKLKASYGFTGNANTGISALQTIDIAVNRNNLGYYFSTPNTPPNPDLGCEKSALLNVGLEFDLFNGRITGSAEYYTRKGKDLIGPKSLAPSAGLAALGIQDYLTNNAKTKAYGIDIDITSKNINGKSFQWTTNFLFSLNKDKVLSYDKTFPSLTVMQSSGGLHNIKTPVVGKPIGSLFSYYFAGLDPANGDPIGYTKDGKTSKDYQALTSVPVSETKYNGPAFPLFWGSFLNTFSYKGLSLSLNITYKMGYFFRAQTISIFALVHSGVMHSDYYKMWSLENPDTKIPSADYKATSSMRDDFFANSEVNVLKAGHFRLQDIQLAYDFTNKKPGKVTVPNLQAYVYVNNLGVLWRANNRKIDPDYKDIPLPMTMSTGIRVNI